MTQIWLVRHGPTHAKVMIGWTDLPADLSDHAALARLSAALPDAPVISSDLSRAVETANRLSPRPRLPHDPRLREIHFGRWEGSSFQEAQAEDPEAIRAFWESPGDATAPGGESWNALSARVTAALHDLCHLPQVIVTAHFGAILAAVQLAGGMSAREVLAHRIEPLSITRITLGPKPALHEVNHLP